MNRRGFFGRLLGGVAVLATMPLVPSMPVAPCAAGGDSFLDSIMIAETARLQGRIAKALASNSPFINLIQGGKFPNNMGASCEDVIS